MKVKISNRNINYFLRQEYGFTSLEQCFTFLEQHPKLHEKIIRHTIEKFTGYHFKDGKLQTYNPYTNKNEVLNIIGVNHIHTKEELLKELSMLHKTRMKMLEQSRKKIVQLSKQKNRDKDLDVQISRREARKQELSNNQSQDIDLER